MAVQEGDMEAALRHWATARGYRVVWGPIEVVESAKQEVRERGTNGQLDRDLFEDELTPVLGSAGGLAARAVVVVAMPRPAHLVSFELDDRRIDAVIPPTYFRYRSTFEDVRLDLLAEGLPGAKVEHLSAPLKAVASRLGLVEYGRNNITYAPGLGSYIQLCGYVTDATLPAMTDPAAAGARLMERCAHCSACRRVCPTGAIRGERVLLHAERCLTFANERPGAWPEWIDESAHHCLFGCLACQQSCPANPPLRVERTGVCFSAEETSALLASDDAHQGRTETGVRVKLAWLGQPYSEPALGRNLKALVAAQDARASGAAGIKRARPAGQRHKPR